jgi:two-component system cell cycle response regulator
MKALVFCVEQRREEIAFLLGQIAILTEVKIVSPTAIIGVDECDVFIVVAGAEQKQQVYLNLHLSSVSKGIPVVYLTSLNDPSRAEMLDLGCCDCLAFEMRLDELTARLRIAVEGKKEIKRLSLDKQAMSRSLMEDALTGLCNRKMFDHALQSELSRFKRQSIPFGLVFLDIDYFKRVNDTYGHQVGDHVLRAVAKRIASSMRELDIPCRYGGEEFALILPGLTATEAYAAAERVRKLIETIPPAELKGPERITVSLGVCSTHIVDDRQSVTAMQLIDWADQALYEAKHKGRNRVEKAQRPLENLASKKA